ncbi:hypothetical protein [Candidatus Nitrososphaera sp. FF02]|uniref:hypothetical protein n=1 Tax=Candidatus Nitrososphaera sp. FF02 TaxID=3398226 RepID=UPI0039E87CFC
MVASTAKTSDKIIKNFGSIATAATGLTAGIIGFSTSFSTLEKAQTKADQAQLTYAKSLETLNEMQEKGTYSSVELANQQERVRIAAEKAKQAKADESDVWLNFLANVPAQMVSFGVSANSIGNMLRASNTTTAVSVRGMSFAYTGALGSMNVANAVTTASTNTLSMALKAAFLSNPIGLVIMGITTVVMLLVTNIDAVTEALTAAGKAIFDFLFTYFRPFAELISWVGDALGMTNDKLGTDMPQAAQKAGDALDDFGTKSKDALDTANEAIAGMNGQLSETIELADEAFAVVSRNINNLPSTINDTLRVSDSIQVNRPGVTVKRAPGSEARIAADNETTSRAIAGAKARSKNLGGVFVAGKGRVLDTGGTLYEDVFGFGAETGTPHLLHKGEDIVPPGKSGRGNNGGPTYIYIGSELVAEIVAGKVRVVNEKHSRFVRQTSSAFRG